MPTDTFLPFGALCLGLRRLAPALIVLAVLLSPGQPAGADSREYRAATVAWAGWSPLHVADEKGFWEQLGIEVKVVDYEDPIVILEAMRSGRIDFAMDMAGTLVGIFMEGSPVKALAETNWSHGGDRIIVKAGNELRDHCGGPLGVFLNRPSCLYFLGRYLQPRGLCLSDFRVVEINPRDMAAQFAVGRLPAIVSYDPWALQAMEEGGGVCLATSADFPGCIPECLWAYEGLLKTVPPEDVIKMIQGWIRAVKWIGDPVNRAEFMEILSRRTFRKLGPFSEEDLSRLMEGVRIHSPEEMWERNRDQGGLREYLLSLREFLRENCLLNRPYEVPDIFDNRFVMEALASERKEQNTD